LILNESANAYNDYANPERMFRTLLSVALLVLSTIAPQVASAQTTASSVIKTPHIVLRAGTAAAPFGASTVITDFDADGAPDVAIADRTIRNGSHYRIEVRLSGGSTQTVSFLSTKGALRIAAADLDNDHDQDLIVTPVLSGEIVGIWVNDGTGHFARGRDAPDRSSVPTLESIPTLSGSSLALLPIVAGRRPHGADLIDSTPVDEVANETSSLHRPHAPSPTEGFLSSFSTRGPPSRSC
jgi:VCBS repeat protein